MEWYYSLVPNVLAFKTPVVGCFLVFGVSNAKYLAFGTLDGNALIIKNGAILYIFKMMWTNKAIYQVVIFP